MMLLIIVMLCIVGHTLALLFERLEGDGDY